MGSRLVFPKNVRVNDYVPQLANGESTVIERFLGIGTRYVTEVLPVNDCGFMIFPFERPEEIRQVEAHVTCRKPRSVRSEDATGLMQKLLLCDRDRTAAHEYLVWMDSVLQASVPEVAPNVIEFAAGIRVFLSRKSYFAGIDRYTPVRRLDEQCLAGFEEAFRAGLLKRYFRYWKSLGLPVSWEQPATPEPPPPSP